jgi:porphobilinogen synthase
MTLEYRPRRLRINSTLRAAVRETHLGPEHLVYPLFIVPGTNKKNEVKSMPGVYQLSLDRLTQELTELQALGISQVILFGVPEDKDAEGTGADDHHGIIATALRTLKPQFKDMLFYADVCMCEYTSHGHCGILTEDNHTVDNDPTLERLASTALTYAQNGADVIAPSDMMDGRIGYIRKRLDQHGFSHTPIMSYAVKYASAFYGPFRDAADSAPAFGDRKTYQMDPANVLEGLREAALDEAEGADILMVKPALPYLDVLSRVRQQTTLPLAAYHVSGEYAMIKAAALNGWIDEEKVVLETLLSIRRAGASIIITYYAKQAAQWLNNT